jgi:hypothetical protein
MNTTIKVCVALLLFSCKHKDKIVAPAKEKIKISKVNVYLDASASNAGYYEGTTDFKTKVSALLTELVTGQQFLEANDSVVTNLYRLSDQQFTLIGQGKPVVKQFLTETGTKNNTKDNSSTIYEYFDQIMKKTDSSMVAVLISDCILSYPDSIIKKSPGKIKNKEDVLSGELKDLTKINIHTEFDKKENRPAFAVYAYLSDFNGNYFNYQNVPAMQKKFFNRPYYIWILTREKEVLQNFQQHIMSDKNLKPVQQMEFGVTKDESQEYLVLSNLKRYGKWSPDGKKAVRNIVVNEKNKKATFTIAVDLPALIKYNIDSLQLTTGSKNHTEYTAKFISKDSVTAEEIKKLPGETIIQAYKSSSHLLQISITQFVTDKDTLLISMPFTYPAWYNSWSTSDDLDPKTIDNKTFGFDQIIMAFKETMKDDAKKILQLKIPIKK